MENEEPPLPVTRHCGASTRNVSSPASPRSKGYDGPERGVRLMSAAAGATAGEAHETSFESADLSFRPTGDL